MAKLRKDGKENTEQKKEILKGDVEKLYSVVFTGRPQRLLYHVYYEVVLHFGRSGREDLRQMTNDFLKLSSPLT